MTPLKIGILLDSENVPAWIYWIIEELLNSSFAEVSLVAYAKKPLEKIKKNKSKNTFFKLISRIEYKFFYTRLDEFHTKKLNLPSNVKVLSIQPISKGISSYINNYDLDIIKSNNLDVILRFGFGILKGEILTLPKYGVWSFHHGDNRISRGRPSCFWELMNKEKKVGAILQVLNEELDNGTVIDKVYSKVLTEGLWPTMNLLFRTAKQMPINKIKQLFQDRCFTDTKNEVVIYDRPLLKYPNNLETLQYISDRFKHLYTSKINRNKRAYWYVIMSKNKNGSNPLGIPLYKCKPLLSDKSCFWADPFVRKKTNGWEILLEEYSFKEKKGKIRSIELDKKGDIVSNKIALEELWHLSYPYIICKDDAWYMIPESAGNKKLTIYKEDVASGNWIPIRNLFEGESIYDCTIYFDNTTYWIFMNKEGVSNRHDQELYIYYTTDFVLNDWTPHHSNPVKIDISSSRPAGSLFLLNGSLIRPSQDCSGGYGSKLILNEVIKLNSREYEERKYEEIEPKWEKKINAIHTVNMIDDFIVYDAKSKRQKL